MIYEKKLYSKVSYLKYVGQRLKLLFFKDHASIQNNVQKLILPYSENELSIESLSYYNSYCHANAFVAFENKVSIDLSKCDSCGMCDQINEVYLRDEGNVSNQIILNLNR